MTGIALALIVRLRASIRGWLQRRHARIVAEGVARLEAKVARPAAPSQALTTPCIVPVAPPRREHRDVRGPAVVRRPRPTLLFDSARVRAGRGAGDD